MSMSQCWLPKSIAVNALVMPALRQPRKSLPAWQQVSFRGSGTSRHVCCPARRDNKHAVVVRSGKPGGRYICELPVGLPDSSTL